MAIKISALISLYNSDKFIENFLDRLSKQTTVKETEFIFIINEDKVGYVTSQVNNFIHIKKIIHTKLESLYKSWNRGIEISDGEYICNLNCDDYHYYDSLNIMKNGLDKHKNASLCSGACIGTNDEVKNFDQINIEERHGINFNNVEYFYFKNRHCGPSPMWRKSVHDKIGLFDESYKAAGDHEMWLRMLANEMNFIKCNEPTVIYFNRNDTLSNRLGNISSFEINNILKKYGEN